MIELMFLKIQTSIKLTIHVNVTIIFFINFSFQPFLGSDCQDLMQKAMIFKEFVFVFVKGNSYRIHFYIHFLY